jgi:hypothetical protein
MSAIKKILLIPSIPGLERAGGCAQKIFSSAEILTACDGLWARAAMQKTIKARTSPGNSGEGRCKQ